MFMATHLIGFGAAASAVAPVTSYANAGGTGDRTASITVTSSVAASSGTLNNFVDGDTTANATGSVDFGSGAISAGFYIRWDFGSNKYIDELKLVQTAPMTSMGLFNIQGSDDASSWTTYGSITYDDVTPTSALTGVPPAGHRYYQIVWNDTSKNFPGQWLQEHEFKIAPGA